MGVANDADNTVLRLVSPETQLVLKSLDSQLKLHEAELRQAGVAESAVDIETGQIARKLLNDLALTVWPKK